MRFALLTILTMFAFASNSVLNRMAVGSGAIDASGFAMIRVFAGALILVLMVGSRMEFRGSRRVVGAGSLAVYMIGFSLAYRTLDAGVGALVLFGTVQIAMFGWGAVTGDRAKMRQVFGASIAFVGLLVVLWPGEAAHVSFGGAALMLVAGLGWAAYSLSGRQAQDPLAETGANFVVTLPLMGLLLFGPALQVTVYGAFLAVLCGAVTSGLGYAMWYTILPQVRTQTAAVMQLSVPVLAIVAGAVVLDEVVTLRLGLAVLLVLGGIAIAVTSQSVRVDRR